MEGDFHGVDDLLYPGGVAEVALILRASRQDIGGEAGGQVGIEERGPRLARTAARRIQALRYLYIPELHVVGLGALERLADTELLHQPADQGTLAAVDARFQAGIV